MADELQNMDFPWDSFDVGHIDDFLFFQDLDRNFLTSEDMVAQFDLAKSAFAQSLIWITNRLPMM